MADYEITSIAFDITDSNWEQELKDFMLGGGWQYIESFRDAVIGNSKRVAILQRERGTQSRIEELEAELKKLRPSLDVKVLKELQNQFQDATQAVAKLQKENEASKFVNEEQGQLIRDMVSKPIPMYLKCPTCGARHIDEEEWATKPHRTHLCKYCKTEWRPANMHTVGVKELPKELLTSDIKHAEDVALHRRGDSISGVGGFTLVGGTIGNGTKVKA